jgi:hypothetical protein
MVDENRQIIALKVLKKRTLERAAEVEVERRKLRASGIGEVQSPERKLSDVEFGPSCLVRHMPSDGGFGDNRSRQ